MLASRNLAGGGVVTSRARALIEARTGAARALLTCSGTAALELACLLLDLGPGDEVIVPSFTFSSCANAIALRGAVPVFVDIRPDTLNIDEERIEDALTPRTRAIMPVHYAGVAAEMNAIMDIARRHGLSVIEDAAQGIGAGYRGRALGTIGRLGAISFHGSLPEPAEIPQGAVKADVLVLHGGADAFTSKEALERFKHEMTAAKARYRVVVYPGAKHGFTDPDNTMRSEMHHIPIGYDANADKNSWTEMKTLLDKVL